MKILDVKKSFKKSNSIKFMQLKFLKKLIMIVKLNNFSIIFNKNPILFKKLIYMFNKKFLYNFYDPIRELPYEKTWKFIYNKIVVFFYIFKKSKPYNFFKYKKYARIKRKISRKIIRNNTIEF